MSALELPQTLTRAASEVDLFRRVAKAVRILEESGDVAHVLVSQTKGEIVVVGADYTHVALRICA